MHHRIIGLILLFVTLTVLTPPITAAGGDGVDACTVDTTLRIAVVGFSVPGLDRLHEKLEGDHATIMLGGCRINLAINYTVVEAPGWALQALRKGLSTAYIDLGRPVWLPDFIDKPVRWVELSLYEDLVADVSSTVLGGHYDHVVAVIGDVDGVSRQLYHVFHHGGTGNTTVWLVGLRLWTSPRYLLTILDLTVAPKPWPRGVPLEEYGVRVDPRSEVYAWNTSLVPGYVADMVQRIVFYHVIGSLHWWPESLDYPLNLLVKTIIVYSDYHRALLVKKELETHLPSVLRTIYPYGGMNYSVELRPLNTYPQLEELIQEATVDQEGYLTLPLTRLKPVAEAIAQSEGAALYNKSGVFVFILLVLDKPARLSLPNLLFTGISMGSWALAAYPGHDNRMLKAGVSTAVAHELGHALGEGHSFDPPTPVYTIDWRLDYIGTPMTYYNPVQAALAASPVYQGEHEKHLATRMLARLLVTLYHSGELDPDTFKTLLETAIHNPDKAYDMLQEVTSRPEKTILVAPGVINGVAAAILVLSLIAALYVLRRSP